MMVVHPSFSFLFLSFLFANLIPDDLGKVGVAAAPAAETSLRRGRKATGCGPRQCYYASLTNNYGGCFHETSKECTDLLNEAGKRPSSASTPTATATASQATSPTTPRPSPRPRPFAQNTQISESLILFRLTNVAEDYTLSPSDRARYMNIIQEVLDGALDDSWDIISVDYLGEYLGERRLQSSQRVQGGYRNKRRLNRTIYLPVLVTLRGDKDLSGLARTFILQALDDKMRILLTNLKSLNPSAFSNVQLSVDELNDLTDVANQSTTTNTNTESANSSSASTSTSTSSSMNTESKSSSSSSSSTTYVVPIWVWIIMAVCIPLALFLILCICMEGCRCCTSKRKKRLDTDDIAIPMAILHGYGNSYGGGYVRRKRDVRKTRERHNMIQSDSEGEGERRHRNSRRRSVERRRYRKNRRDHRESTQRDEYVSNRNSNMVIQIDRSPSRPEQKRSLGMMDKELESEEIIVPDERALVALPAHRASFNANSQREDPPIDSNALVVYDDEQIRFTLEPEGLKIEDVPEPETAVVVYVPPKEPEGTTATLVGSNPPTENEEAPQKKSKTVHYDDDEDEMDDHFPYIVIHRDVSEKAQDYRPENAQFQDTAIRRSFVSTTTQFSYSSV